MPGRLTVVAGPAGSGKSALARHVAGADMWVAAAPATSQIGLGALAPFLTDRGLDAADLSRIAQTGLVTDDFTGVVVLDDANHLDPASAIVIANVIADRHVPMIATLRTGHRLPGPLAELTGTTVTLPPLTLADVTELLTSVLGGPVESGTVDAIHRLTDGSPLFLRHLVRTELRHGRFRQTDGVWWWYRGGALDEGLIGVISENLLALPAAQRRVVDLLAVAETLPAPTVVALCGADAVARAVTGGTVVAVGDAYTLGHPLYVEVGRRLLPAVTRREIAHRTIAALDPATGCPGAAGEMSALRRACLALDYSAGGAAGPSESAAGASRGDDVLLTGAEIAFAAFDFSLAARLLDALDGAGSYPAARLRTVVYTAVGWRDKALAACQAAERLARTDAERAEIVGSRWILSIWVIADLAVAREVIATAPALHGRDRSAVDACRAFSLYLYFRIDDALRLAVAALEDATAPSVRAIAAHAMLNAIGDLGRADEIAHHMGRVEDRHGQGWGVAYTTSTAALIVISLLIGGRIADADAIADRYSGLVVGEPGPSQMHARCILGICALAKGRARTAVARLREVAAGSERWGADAGMIGWDVYARMGLARAHAVLGDVDAARRGGWWRSPRRRSIPAGRTCAPNCCSRAPGWRPPRASCPRRWRGARKRCIWPARAAN